MKCTQKIHESLVLSLNPSVVSGVKRGHLGFFSVSVVAHSPFSRGELSSRNWNWKYNKVEGVREEE